MCVHKQSIKRSVWVCVPYFAPAGANKRKKNGWHLTFPILSKTRLHSSVRLAAQQRKQSRAQARASKHRGQPQRRGIPLTTEIPWCIRQSAAGGVRCALLDWHKPHAHGRADLDALASGT